MAANEDPLEQAIAAQEEAMDSLPDDELAEAEDPEDAIDDNFETKKQM